MVAYSQKRVTARKVAEASGNCKQLIKRYLSCGGDAETVWHGACHSYCVG